MQYGKVNQNNEVTEGPIPLPRVLGSISNPGPVDLEKEGYYPFADDGIDGDYQFLGEPMFDPATKLIRREALDKNLIEVREQMLARVKTAREGGLNRFTKNSGVAAVYKENYLAATRFKVSDATAMTSGKSPEQYLTALGSNMKMSAVDYADYIKAEFTAAALLTEQIENEYLRLTYAFIPFTEDLVDVVTQTRAYEAACHGQVD